MFGDPKKRAAMIVAKMAPTAPDDEASEGEGDMGLESALTALFAAPPGKRAQAFRDAMDLCESAPHEEAGEKE